MSRHKEKEHILYTIKEISDLEKRLKELSDTKQKLILQYFKEGPPDDSFLKYLYWNKILPKYTLKECYDAHANVHRMNFNGFLITSATTKCWDCQKNITVYVKSLSDLSPKKNKPLYKQVIDRCPLCQEKYDIEDRRRVELRRASEKEEHKLEMDRITKLKAMPYSEYLQTAHWKRVRAYSLKKANYKCQLCHSASILHVHHKTYEHRGEEDKWQYWKDNIIVLCQSCHEKFHDKMVAV